MGQALEGKDVKDLLLNVGSGGGAAAATGGASGGASGDAAAADEKVEEKAEEGTSPTLDPHYAHMLIISQRRRSPTTTWASVCSIRFSSSPFLSSFAYSGFHQRISGRTQCIFPHQDQVTGCSWRYLHNLLLWKTLRRRHEIYEWRQVMNEKL